MLQDVSNHTPSPGKDSSGLARRHSPWTAARLRKKNRAAPPTPKLPPGLESGCSSGFSSPETCVKTSPYAGDDPIAFHFEAAVTLNSPATPGSKPSSAHSSPALDRYKHTELHPAKAFIVSSSNSDGANVQQQAGQGFAGPERLALSPGGDQRPVWFGGQQECGAEAGENVAPRTLEHSLSCPEATAQPQAAALDGPWPGRAYSVDGPCPPAPLSRRSVTVRRKSWLASGMAALGSGLNSSSDSDRWQQMQHDMLSPQQKQQQAHTQDTQQQDCQARSAADAAMAVTHNMCAQEAPAAATSSGTADTFWMQRSPAARAAAGAAAAGVCREVFELGSSSVSHMELDDGCEAVLSGPSLEWFHQQLTEAATEGDLERAQALWAQMQQHEVMPTVATLNQFLQCWHYGCGNPQEAQQVVREMCGAADIVPDSATGHYLAAIDMGWQQLEFAAAS